MDDTPLFDELLPAALARLQTELLTTMPQLAPRLVEWLIRLAGGRTPVAYFTHPLAFPALALPWWLEKTLHPAPDAAFQSELVYSTINGYYYIRLLDNVMDGHRTNEGQLLPAAGFFHTQFQRAYQHDFDDQHPFWEFFATTWFHAAEVTWQDATFTDIDLTQFQQVSGQKVSAGKIPLAAVCYHYQRPDLLEEWLSFFEQLGNWFQFSNDVFDWHKDWKYQTQTYFLSEARRRQRADESIAQWVIREGFAWACDQLQMWMQDLRELASELDSPDVTAFLDRRAALLAQQEREVTAGFEQLERIAAILNPHARDNIQVD